MEGNYAGKSEYIYSHDEDGEEKGNRTGNMRGRNKEGRALNTLEGDGTFWCGSKWERETGRGVLEGNGRAGEK